MNNSPQKITDNVLPDQGWSDSMPDIKQVDVYETIEQDRVNPRQVASGLTRGQQQINGSIVITDNDQTVRLIMGYQEGAF